LAPEGLLPLSPPEEPGLESEDGALVCGGTLLAEGSLPVVGALACPGALALGGALAVPGSLAPEGMLPPAGWEVVCAELFFCPAHKRRPKVRARKQK
jgi:hypothetical protein